MYDLQLISPSSKSLMVLYQVAHIPLLCMVFHAALCNTGNTGPGLLYKTDRIIGKCLWNYCSTPCCWKCIFQSQFRWPETIICSTQNSIRWLQSFLFSPCFWIELTYLVFCSGEFMLGLVLQINCYHELTSVLVGLTCSVNLRWTWLRFILLLSYIKLEWNGCLVKNYDVLVS